MYHTRSRVTKNRLLIRDKISKNTYDSDFSDETRHDETYSFTYQQNNWTHMRHKEYTNSQIKESLQVTHCTDRIHINIILPYRVHI